MSHETAFGIMVVIHNSQFLTLALATTAAVFWSAWFVLFRNGDFITRSSNVESVYRRVIEPNPIGPINPPDPDDPTMPLTPYDHALAQLAGHHRGVGREWQFVPHACRSGLSWRHLLLDEQLLFRFREWNTLLLFA